MVCAGVRLLVMAREVQPREALLIPSLLCLAGFCAMAIHSRPLHPCVFHRHTGLGARILSALTIIIALAVDILAAATQNSADIDFGFQSVTVKTSSSTISSDYNDDNKKSMEEYADRSGKDVNANAFSQSYGLYVSSLVFMLIALVLVFLVKQVPYGNYIQLGLAGLACVLIFAGALVFSASGIMDLYDASAGGSLVLGWIAFVFSLVDVVLFALAFKTMDSPAPSAPRSSGGNSAV